VLALSRQQRQRIGQASRARIVAQYEIGSVARRYADLYESLANGRQP
jgi:glycosyltransferase involved in cell wall biosynthesis